MLELVKKTSAQRGINNIQVMQGCAESLPFDHACFDVIVTRFSAHHWQDLKQALQQIYHVLKPQGVLIAIDSIGSSQPILDTFLQSVELLRDPSHVRNYSFREWLDFTESYGLTPLNVERQVLPICLEDWVKRMHTPKVSIHAIRYLQSMASDVVISHFGLKNNGDFQLDVGYMVFKK